MTPRANQSRRADRLAALLLTVMVLVALSALTFAFTLFLHDDHDPRFAPAAPHVSRGESSSEGAVR